MTRQKASNDALERPNQQIKVPDRNKWAAAAPHSVTHRNRIFRVRELWCVRAEANKADEQEREVVVVVTQHFIASMPHHPKNLRGRTLHAPAYLSHK